MITVIKDQLKSSLLFKFIVLYFIAVSIWWVSIYSRGLMEGLENNSFTLIYPFMSLIGGLFGLHAAKQWGGFKSVFGKSITFLAIGLLFQFFGQAAYAYFIYIEGIEVPYPSLGDIGYFGSILFYILGAVYLGRMTSVAFKLKSFFIQSQAIIIPLIVLLLSYIYFLRDYTLDPSQYIKTFLDFGYPLGQAVYVSLAISIALISRKILGGIMKGPIILLLISLVIQYFCDFMFLYQSNQGSWYVGGINDYMYFISYFFMAMTLVYIQGAFKEIVQNQN